MIQIAIIGVLFPLFCHAELITVETSRGAVQGFDHDFGTDKSERFYGYGQMFLGIPYAKAPLGERRFTLPEDVCQYNDEGTVHNATFYRPRCWQTEGHLHPSTDMSEDCLYLNVISPNVSGSYPVMFYIHGGTFTTGGADIYHWKGAVRNLVSRGVVVVTIQYRIGVLGFFTTFTERFPPNRGLYDQIVALRWVNEEIANFGGDASRITIFGQSAGGSSVSDLSLSPLARGLFHQLIQTSGSSLQELETIDDARGSIHQKRAAQICQINATEWGTPGKDEEIMACLLEATPQSLIAFDMKDEFDWNVSVDGALLPDFPEVLAEMRPAYPVLIGDMLEEMGTAVPGVQEGDISGVGPGTNLGMVLDKWPFDNATSEALSARMIEVYSGDRPPADDDNLAWTLLEAQIWTGAAFDQYMLRDIEWHTANGNEKTWLFTLVHRSLLPLGTEVDGWMPISHNSDLPYLWFYPEIWETYNATAGDFATADRMGEIWTDFAKNGKLQYPAAGKERNFITIDAEIGLETDWRAPADQVFNQEFPKVVGDIPPLIILDESWEKLRDLGQKVVTKWNSMQCSPIGSTIRPADVTTSAGTKLNALGSACLLSTILLLAIR